jgi:enoyl-CoA hydratase/carnithine racemase
MMNFDTLLYEQQDALVTIRLNRPERLNAVNNQMRRDLNAAFDHFVNDSVARVGILTGVGRAFCVGRDIKEQAEGQMDNWAVIPDRPPLFVVPRSEKPIVTAANGHASGLGYYMFNGGDIRVASDTAEFSLPQLQTGLQGCWDMSISQGIPWAVAVEIQVLGRAFTAARGYELGLVNKVVPPEQLEECALEYAHALLALPPVHLAMTMRMLREAQPLGSDTMWQKQWANFEYIMTLRDTQEAAAAFAEKREPNFTGE